MCVYLHTKPSKESLEVKLPTIWIDEAAEVGRGREEKKSEEKESAERRSRGEKSTTLCFFPMFCGSGGSKSSLNKAAGAEPYWGDEKSKIARCCSAKHISKSKCTKHHMLGPLFDVQMSKKALRCWNLTPQNVNPESFVFGMYNEGALNTGGSRLLMLFVSDRWIDRQADR